MYIFILNAKLRVISNQNYIFLIDVFHAVPQGYIFYICLRFDLNENSASGMRLTHKSVRCLHPADILQNRATLNQRGRIVKKKEVIVFSLHRKSVLGASLNSY